MFINLKSFVLIALSFALSFSLFAQEGKVVQKPANVQLNPAHRIVFQMTSGDTLAHKQLMKQIGNILTIAPGTKMEVVCHGSGLEMLIADKSIVADKVSKHVKAGVIFNACEFSMKERNVEKSQMIADATFVPAGIIEIVTRQEHGWSYIKAGF